MPADLKFLITGRIAGLALDARRAVYDQARAELQREIRAAAPFMPVQTVVARRRELEEAIRAAENEATHWGDDWPLVSEQYTRPVPPPRPPLPPAPPPEEEKLEPQAQSAIAPATSSQPIPSSPLEAEAPAVIAKPVAPTAAVSDQYRIDEESEQVAPPINRRGPFLLYAVMIAACIGSIALAVALLGIGGKPRERQAAPAAPPAAPAAPAGPRSELMKGAGFQVAAQDLLKNADAHLARGDLDRAISAYDDAIRFDPAPAAYAARASAHWKKGNAQAAIRDYDAALERNPSVVAHYFQRALALGRTGDFQRAAGDLDRVLAAEPGNTAALVNRCWARAVISYLQEALEDCNAAIKLKPGDAEALGHRGFVFLRLGRLDRSVTDYDAALRQQPLQAALLYGRGLAKIGRGDRGGGNEDVQAARAIDPDIAATFARYGIR